MKIRITVYLLIPVLISTLELTGCVTAGKGTLPSGGEMTMAQIYKDQTGMTLNSADSESSPLPRSPLLSEASYVSDGVEQNKSIDQLFKPLPNPEIAMYVYPHLVTENGEAEPVPGYNTAFFMYRNNNFARPNESTQG